MTNNSPDPLNPDDEQILFDKLSMNEMDYKILEFIRKDMRKLLNRLDNIKDKE